MFFFLSFFLFCFVLNIGFYYSLSLNVDYFVLSTKIINTIKLNKEYSYWFKCLMLA